MGTRCRKHPKNKTESHILCFFPCVQKTAENHISEIFENRCILRIITGTLDVLRKFRGTSSFRENTRNWWSAMASSFFHFT